MGALTRLWCPGGVFFLQNRGYLPQAHKAGARVYVCDARPDPGGDLAGGECVAGEAKGRSFETTEEELAGADPDVLLIMPCGYGLAATRRDAAEHAELLARLAPRAIDNGRAFVVDGSSYFNRSGPRIVDGIEILGGLLHPELLALPPAGADTWKPDAITDHGAQSQTEIASGI